MEQLLVAYKSLLHVYTNEVKALELLKKESNATWLPYKVLNSRMFTFDEYLTNVYHGGFGYEEKNRVISHLISFIALYERSSEEQKGLFESTKPKNDYQEYLDELFSDKHPFIDYLTSQLKEIDYQKARSKMPYPPQRRNASRQQAAYRKEMSEYEDKLASLNNCRKEVEERIELYKRLLNS